MTKHHTARVLHGAPRWLTAAADDPAKVRTEWFEEPAEPRLLSTGRTFDAVVVTDELGIRALEAYRGIASPALPTVIDHRSRKVAFLVAACGLDFFAATMMQLRGQVPYRYLGEGGFVMVPGPAPEVGARHQWLCPPRPNPDLSAGAVVMLAAHLVASAHRMAKEAMRRDG